MRDVVIADRSFSRLVMPEAPLLKLADGFAWLEGPVWIGDQGVLLFSDIPNDRVMRWREDGGVDTLRHPSGFENGHARDRQGRLISCSHRARAIVRTEHDGGLTTLANRFQNKRLNSPNDVVVKSDGTIWFTDPPYGIQTDYQGGKEIQELPPTVYRLCPDTCELTVVADDFDGPNGLCFSPDERLLYIVETGNSSDSEPREMIRVFDVSGGGEALSVGRFFHRVAPGHSDGIRCDEDGRVWSAAGDGVHCISPSGALLGRVLVPSVVSNIAFGGRARSRLFICASQALYAIYLNVRGASWP